LQDSLKASAKHKAEVMKMKSAYQIIRKPVITGKGWA
jgi:hypothetical protein